MIESNLRSILDKNNISISDLSKSTKISRKTLTMLADNKSNGIKFSTLNTLINVLGVSVNEILNFSSDETITISALTITDDNVVTFLAKHSNKTTHESKSMLLTTTFKYFDNIFSFSSPAPVSGDDNWPAFFKLVTNSKDTPTLSTGNTNLAMSLVPDSIDNSRSANILHSFQISNQLEESLVHDFSIELLLRFCIAIGNSERPYNNEIWKMENTSLPAFIIHWKLREDDFDPEREFIVVLKQRDIVEYMNHNGVEF
ncbi:XRE family transcriptional regulator [Lactiplantibacillus garii]|uniref:XRE family transcriptional regulator n=1 Tax=Lactiplantibacillus garii TaxID=2306423 RepID=A0A3R8KGH1_9LACO|nr:helix-turn-helix transcriptional regulator [Lactiplantibacillus garii]RRK09353.1 XRE family transcriptional regulator [Lactiplantibacillus garii]